MLAATKQRVSDYLRLMVECEEAAGGLYRACAERWPEEAAFWQRLAEEENEHALRLDMIRERVRTTPHGVGLLRPYPPATIQSFIALIRKETEEVRSGEMTSAAVLLRAKDLEQSLIGSQPLRGFSFDDPRFAPYWREVSRAWERHARRLAERVAGPAPELALAG